jgi:DNA polymerase III delta prime subunit
VITLKDRILLFLEDRLIRWSLSLIIALLLANHSLLLVTDSYGFVIIEDILNNHIHETIANKEGVLSTIAAIFIGIYITVFFFLGSIKIDSTFTLLSRENFEKLLMYIKWAFIGAFSYLLFSIVSTMIVDYNIHLKTGKSIVELILILYMFLTALRFSVIIFLSYRRDLDKLHEELEEEKQSKQKYKILMHRLDLFLKKQEEERDREKAEKVAEILQAREKDRSKK